MYAFCYVEGVFGVVRRGSHEERVVTYLLVLGSPGLIMVDHIHFQYNGMLLGKPASALMYIYICQHQYIFTYICTIIHMQQMACCRVSFHLHLHVCNHRVNTHTYLQWHAVGSALFFSFVCVK